MASTRKISAPVAAAVLTDDPHDPETALSLIELSGMWNCRASACLISVPLVAATAGSGSRIPVLIWYDPEPPVTELTDCAEEISAPWLAIADRASSSVPMLAGSVNDSPPL